MVDFGEITWIIDEYHLDRLVPTGHPSILDAAAELGCNAVTASSDDTRALDVGPGPGCMVVYGSRTLLHRARGRVPLGWSPVAYDGVSLLDFSSAAAHLGDRLVSRDYVILPLADARRRGLDLFPEGYFIKPNSPTKAFTGQVVRPRDAAERYLKILSTGMAGDTTLCILSSPVEIGGEFRFVIAGGQVVAGSQYRWDGRLDIRSDVLPSCQDLAQEIAELSWQPAGAYVCDVGITPDGPRVVELNPFSSSGIYACDTRAIVRAVSMAAWRQFTGD